ncbi:MAG: hypothetical protein FWE42_08940 [Defluviitaleaceae bacterium]|nr:hypothetical protein [Defluviitaleaceae bacterium]
MQHRFIVNPILCAVSAATSAIFLAMGIVMFPLNRYGSAVIFLCLFVVYLYVAVSYGAVISVDKYKICRRFAGIYTQELTWGRIKEVGVCGTTVFRNGITKKRGFFYIYFSDEKMDEHDRFDMILRWPPKRQFYLMYNERRLNAVQELWNNKIDTYNVGKLSIGGKS